ncbi:MAG: DUF4178 domain-containing protein [Solirubrobacteraceae bacterium]|nr:DUF4178 domain-containing protein [Solirubrobacteraceae bacterium]
MVPVIIVLVVLVALAAIWWLRARGSRATPAISGPIDPLAEGPGGPLDGLGVGAVVTHGGHDYVVRGQLRFDEDGYVWHEYHLDTGQGDRAWLSVDLSDGTDVALWRPIEATGGLEPSGADVEWAGVSYRKVESGRARYTSTGTTGLPESGQSWYADYRAADGARLAFERWSAEGSWEVSTGEGVPAHLLEIYAAGRAGGGDV